MICLWSGPRNVSTALMYSFAEHPEIDIVDEPLYGHYLRVSNADHPGRDEVVRSMDCAGDAVIANLLRRQSATSKRLFVKHMAHHLIDVDRGFLSNVSNVLLIRDPREMLPSLVKQLPNLTLVDTGLQQQAQLYVELQAEGAAPSVLDSRELLLDPAGVLQTLCAEIGLEFSPAMLSWPAGQRQQDGIWAKHWYHAVHQSTGFSAYVPKPELPAGLRAIHKECQPWYEQLFTHAIRADRKHR